ncbi:hypothetical protein [Salininema proteolyticum]|uniref:Antirestriction protein ArdA n=1 Tax=Salininema proteolyticum TaxID=1607685 RepID=A0ABV8TZD6_9ACTN
MTMVPTVKLLEDLPTDARLGGPSSPGGWYVDQWENHVQYLRECLGMEDCKCCDGTCENLWDQDEVDLGEFELTVLSWTDYTPGGHYDRANACWLDDKFGDYLDADRDEKGSVTITLSGEIPHELYEALTRDMDYPLYDDEYLSDLEHSVQESDWYQWGCADFERELRKLGDDFETFLDDLDSKFKLEDYLADRFTAAHEAIGLDYHMTCSDSGSWSNFDAAVEHAAREIRTQLPVA